ncbi:MAG: outer membrane protein assembly factor BamB [Thiothrix sp.]|nr:outer membrane protein assembly factor BamB [Thiothrix sp.]HPQ95317.1 outer membrane protein assembly factor BamB [Thiolinea sp.]
MIMLRTGLLSGLLLAASLLSGCGFLNNKDDTNEAVPLDPPKALKELKAAHTVRTLWSVGLDQSRSSAGRLSWTFGSGNAGKELKLYPWVDGQQVIVAAGSQVRAFDKQTGTPRWSTPVDNTISAGVNGADGLILVGTDNGNAIALDATNGAVRWVEKLNSEIQSVAAPHNGRALFRSIDGSLNALDSQTGELLWSQTRSAPDGLTLYGTGVPVVVSTLVVAGFDNGALAAFELGSGKPVWETLLSAARGPSERDRITDVDGRIKVVGSALFAGAYGGRLAGINLQDGQLAWERPFSTSTGLDADASGLYVTEQNGDVWKLNPQTGAPIWKQDDLQYRRPTAPTLSGNYLVLGDFEGYLHWISQQDALIYARLRGDPAGYSVPPLADGNVIYTFGKGGLLAAYSLQ